MVVGAASDVEDLASQVSTEAQNGADLAWKSGYCAVVSRIWKLRITAVAQMGLAWKKASRAAVAMEPWDRVSNFITGILIRKGA